MPTEIIVTALPNGKKGSTLRLSAFISHRLTGGSKLGQFPEARKWGLLDLKYTVLINGVPRTAKVVSVRDPKMWEALFNDNTPVDGYVYKSQATRELRTYSVKMMGAALGVMYAGAMQSAPGLPLNLANLANGLKAFDPLGLPEDVPKYADQSITLGDRKVKMPGAPYAVRAAQAGRAHAETLRSRYSKSIGAYRNTPGAAAPNDPAMYAFEAKQFFEPWSTAPLKNIKPPDFDYHKALAAVANHPELMRSLGLVVDFEIEDPGINANGVVAIQVVGLTAGVTTKSLQTRFAVKTFLPVPKVATEIQDGFLTVGNEKYTVTQIDIDGLTMKLLGLAQNLRNQVRSGTDEAVATLPALRSGGFGVARDNRAADVKGRLQAQDTIAPAVPLSYDEIIRGYRVDVFDRGQWRTLCGRVGKYDAPGRSLDLKATPDVVPEGWVSMGLTSAPPATGGGAAPTMGPMKLHEHLFQWTGWSLVAERPGGAMDDMGAARRGEGNTIDPDFKLSMTLTAAPGTLPTLRFGKSYRFRVRTVDLAGNSAPISANVTGTQATNAQPYFRWDPVVAPGVYAKVDFRPGESETHLVIRKFKTKAPEPTTRREVLPPSGEQSLSETHGMFDEPVNSGKPSAAKYQIIKDHDKTVRDVVAPGTDETVGILVPNSLNSIPYLVDPVASGITIGYIPLKSIGVAPALQAKNILFPKPWPEVGSVTLEVKAQAGAAVVAPTVNGTVLSVPLRAGEVVQAYLASSIKEEAVELFGPYHFLNAAQKATFKPIARDGGLWMLTPTRRMTLVHATQVPEADAGIVDFEVVRKKGDTTVQVGRVYREANIQGSGPGSPTKLITHAWSTSEVQFDADWTDDLDLLEEPRRTTLQRQVNGLFAFKKGIPREEFIVPLLEKHELGDTKYRRITYTLTGYSRFPEYFPGEDTTRVSANKYEFDALSTAQPEAPIVEYIVPTFGWSRAAGPNNVASRRNGGGLRVYLRRPWFSSGNGERLAIVFPPQTVDPFTPDKGTERFTLFGADPLFKAPDVTGLPKIQNFVGAAPTKPLSPDEEEFMGQLVPGASYPVQFDDERQMWYADVEIDLGAAYFPFVRLAVARYQEHSLPGLEISSIVRTDFMQLTPDRAANVQYLSATRIKAKVIGYSFTQPDNSSGTRRVILGTVEEKSGAASASDQDLAWKPVKVDGKVLEDLIPLEGPPVNFRPIERRNGDERPYPSAPEESTDQQDRIQAGGLKGQVQKLDQIPNIIFRPLPQGPGEFTLPTARTDRQYRLVIREYEVIRTDYAQPIDFDKDVEGVNVDALGNPMVGPPAPIGGRLVYMDIIPLS